MTAADLRPGLLDVEVVIPLKWSGGREERYQVEEMAAYLAGLHRTVAGITVVDGSPEPVRREHERAWGSFVRMLVPRDEVLAPPPGEGQTGEWTAAAERWLNGKVVGALTGIHAARRDKVVLADDDVRHTPDSLARLVAALDEADLVRPVNVFDAWPWQARWDGARSLLNVALATDWPGTFALRRATVIGCGGWSAEVLFENLELWRTVEAAGGRTLALDDVTVWRRPPSVGQFWSQRVRQAYDDLAQPARLLAELAILPTLAMVAGRDPRGLGAIAGAVVLLAAQGRRRVGTDRVPPTVPLWAPVWVLERGVCVWLAVANRLAGGVRYHDLRLRRAAHSPAALRRALATR